jgi:lipopolysaccharide biosynthesis glycosyltransferase
MVYPLAVLLSSLSENSRRTFRLTVGYLHGALSANERAFLSDICNRLGIDHDFLELGNDPRFISQGHISPTTFAKFLLADHIQGPHLWIDADTIALPGWDSIFDVIANLSNDSHLAVAQRHSLQAQESTGPNDLPFNAGVLGWPQGPRKDWSSALSKTSVVATQEQYLFNQLYAPTATWVSERFNALTYRIDSIDSAEPPFIIHYAGAHKPWHLARHLKNRCQEHRCPWSAWFRAEEKFLHSLATSDVLSTALILQESALRAGKSRWQRDHTGFLFLRMLRVIGPFAGFVLWALAPLRQWIPRGTHPLH